MAEGVAVERQAVNLGGDQQPVVQSEAVRAINAGWVRGDVYQLMPYARLTIATVDVSSHAAARASLETLLTDAATMARTSA